MNFNLDEWNLPPADVTAIADEQMRLACGVLVFDSWIINNDRHDEQLHYDKIKRALYVFDHHKALYGEEGFVRLMNHANSLGVRFHCLIKEIKSLVFVDEWLDRISQIPRYYIRDAIVDAAYVTGSLIVDINSYTDFLCERRSKIKDLIIANRNHFDNARMDLFFNAGQIADGCAEYQI